MSLALSHCVFSLGGEYSGGGRQIPKDFNIKITNILQEFHVSSFNRLGNYFTIDA